MTLEDVRHRCITLLRTRIRNGELTERGLARLVGISQPHVHNVLCGKKTFSLEATDQIMLKLRLGIFDLVDPAEWSEWQNRQ